MTGLAEQPRFTIAAVGDAAARGPTPREVVAKDGESLLRALQRCDAPIISVCGGQASCGACRVAIDAAWFARLTPPGDVESALLEYLDDPLPDHRLACQVVLSPALVGLSFCIAPAP